MKTFKLRASAGGKLAGKRGLGRTGYSYIEKWVKEQIYKRRESFENKYTIKGNEQEDAAIDYIADKLGYGILFKNEDYFENDYFQGTPDVILPDLIIDIKNSWSPFTFPLFETEVNPDYFYQGQIYMNLTGIRQFKVIYCLMDTPFELIESEARSYCWKNNLEFDDAILREFTEKMTYNDVPENFRVKEYSFEYDPKTIELLTERVEEARLYIDTLL